MKTYAKQALDLYYKEIQDLYLSNNYPWIIGYSGGKDSTAVVQLIWEALSKLSREKLTKEVYIISSDTLIEIPKVLNIVDKNLEKINYAAKIEGLPFKAIKVFPNMIDTFWVNLIGRGYPAPTSEFRWCTDRLKIDPANKFILDTANKYGEVIVVLGVRKAESAQREKTINNHKIQGSILSRHTTLPGAYVYTPISEFETKEIWDYLLNNPSPWGGNNLELLRLYRKANAGECPLIIDKFDRNAPSCGNSRFGCWVCTVVKNEKSLSSLIENGEKWLKPLQDFRQMLVETQEPAKKHLYRDYKRRNGTVYFLKNDENDNVALGRGPYYFWFRKKILEELLWVEKKLNDNFAARYDSYQDNIGYIHLITNEELAEIRRLWLIEEHDWEDSLLKIYKKVYGVDLDILDDTDAIFSGEDLLVLEKLSESERINKNLLPALLNYLYHNSNTQSKSKLLKGIEKILNEEWRSEEEILREAKSDNFQ